MGAHGARTLWSGMLLDRMILAPSTPCRQRRRMIPAQRRVGRREPQCIYNRRNAHEALYLGVP